MIHLAFILLDANAACEQKAAKSTWFRILPHASGLMSRPQITPMTPRFSKDMFRKSGLFMPSAFFSVDITPQKKTWIGCRWTIGWGTLIRTARISWRHHLPGMRQLECKQRSRHGRPFAIMPPILQIPHTTKTPMVNYALPIKSSRLFSPPPPRSI